MAKDKLYVLISKSISPHQLGFLAGKSSITNLVYFTKYVVDSMEAGYQVDVIYTHFSKAFDKVNHNILIGKLGYTVKFSQLGNHLPKGRTQRLKICFKKI